MVDALTTGIIWLAVGAALVLLIYEQSRRLALFARMLTRRRRRLQDDIRDICHDEECVALYECVAASIPDAVLYFALADTRRRVDVDGNLEIAVVFAEALRRVADEYDCQLRVSPQSETSCYPSEPIALSGAGMKRVSRARPRAAFQST